MKSSHYREYAREVEGGVYRLRCASDADRYGWNREEKRERMDCGSLIIVPHQSPERSLPSLIKNQN